MRLLHFSFWRFLVCSLGFFSSQGTPFATVTSPSPIASANPSADFDDDCLTNAAETLRGTNPNNPDTDGDGAPDALDGWPRHAKLAPAPLPEARYAVVPLRALGFPLNYYLRELDDQNNVLCTDDGAQFHYWNAALNQIEATGLHIEATHPSGSRIYSNLSPAGEVIGSTDHYFHPGKWRSPQTFPTDLGFPDDSYYAGAAMTINAGGRITGAAYKRNESGDIYLYYGGWDFGSASWLAGAKVEKGAYVTGGTLILPTAINDQGLMGVTRQTIDINSQRTPADLSEPVKAGILDGSSFIELGEGVIFYLTSTSPSTAFGRQRTIGGPDELWWAIKNLTDMTWSREPLHAWDSATGQTAPLYSSAEVPAVNERLEMVRLLSTGPGSAIVRNGVIQKLASLVVKEWAGIYAVDINSSGVMLGYGVRIVDASGQPVSATQQVSEPVWFYPVELSSEDRLLKGSLRVPEGSTDFSLGFRHVPTGTSLGTFSGLEPSAVGSPTLIYDSEEAMLADSELDAEQAGTLDPRAVTQPVVFYRDAQDPRRLHFATAFDQAGEVELTLSFATGATAAPVSASVRYTLVSQSEISELIATLDQRIESITIPEISDYDLDIDGDGVPDGGPSDLIVAAQPGTMEAPGDFIPGSMEDDPLNLVLLVNSDDDNLDTVPDSQLAGLDAADDDLVQIVLRAPSDLEAMSGTLVLTHDGGPALRLRFPTDPPLASGVSVDLASPTGPLAALATGPVILYAEGLAPATDVAITLSYTPAGANTPTVSDTLHLSIADPTAFAALQIRHRYFALDGDLIGLFSRTYATNGAYRQHRIGLLPIGEGLPLKNQGLLARALFPLIGSLKGTAAFYRGTADGFWLGLKSDGEGIADLIIFAQEENKMARMRALAAQFRELVEAFRGIPTAQLPTLMRQMATTITRDLYSDAEAALGWEPLTPNLDPQVVAYMCGMTNGFVGEQTVVGMIPVGGSAVVILGKIAPVVRGVVTAVKNGTHYVLPAMDASSKAGSWIYRGIQKALGSTDEVRDALEAVQRARRTAPPGWLTNPVIVMSERLRTRPDLFDEIIAIWSEWLPRPVSAAQIEALTRNYARLIDLAPGPTDLSDDALKSWARFYGSIGGNPQAAAEKTRLLAKVFGAGDGFDASTFDKAGFDAVMKQLKQDFVIEGSQHSAWKSINSGLIYDKYPPTTGSPEGHRITHVFAHTVANYKPGTHSVFEGLRKDLLPLLDEAWNKRPSVPTLVAGGRDKYLIDMGKTVGKSGERRIYIAVEQNTSRVVSAFPVNNTFIPN